MPKLLFAIVAVGFEIVLFLVFLTILIRIILWFWHGLPRTLGNLYSERFGRTAGVLLALLIFPDLVSYVGNVVVRLLAVVPDELSQATTANWSQICGDDSDKCAQTIGSQVPGMLADMGRQLLAAINIGTAPVTDALAFLLLAGIFAGLIGILQREFVAGQVLNRTSALISAQFRQRLFFVLLIILSFYLALISLLAIPLFQDKTGAGQLTSKTLGDTFVTIRPNQADFDLQFPPKVTNVDDPITSEPAPANQPDATYLALSNYYHVTLEALSQYRGQAQDAWTAGRSRVQARQAAVAREAASTFDAGVETSSGHRQTATHYNTLIAWYQSYVLKSQDLLAACLQQIKTADSNLRLALADARSAEGLNDRFQIAVDGLSANSQGYANAIGGCRDLDFSSIEPMPRRQTISEMLGTIGAWSGWLLNTEQMPVVVIVGLVGFSVLGATVSRSVRAAEEKIVAGITFDDLLIVIASGTTAAVVVFLAAYGGLAVLGNSSSDPNPYIVFATCLVAAVYSDRVWTWARDRVLARAIDQGSARSNGAGSRPPATDPDAAPPTEPPHNRPIDAEKPNPP